MEICVVTTWSYKVDTKKQVSSQVSFNDEHDAADSKAQEHFNPGHAQHGGWHKPEDSVHLGSSVSDNQWHAGDSSSFTGNDEPLKPDSHGSFRVGQTVGFPGSGQPEAGKYSTFTGGSLNHGGDLIVGQGSVQRPANLANQYHSGTFNQGVGSFPVQAHIAPGASQFSQVISSGSKKPSYSVSEHPEYVSQHAGVSAYRPSASKPALPQPHPQKPASYNGQGGQHEVHSSYPGFSSSPVIGQGSQFPSHSSAGRPPIYSSPGGLKPQNYKPKPVEGHHAQGGNRYPGHLGPFGSNSGLRNGPKNPPPKPPTKYQPSASQPSHHYTQPQSSSGVKYFHK